MSLFCCYKYDVCMCVDVRTMLGVSPGTFTVKPFDRVEITIFLSEP